MDINFSLSSTRLQSFNIRSVQAHKISFYEKILYIMTKSDTYWRSFDKCFAAAGPKLWTVIQLIWD